MTKSTQLLLSIRSSRLTAFTSEAIVAPVNSFGCLNPKFITRLIPLRLVKWYKRSSDWSQIENNVSVVNIIILSNQQGVSTPSCAKLLLALMINCFAFLTLVIKLTENFCVVSKSDSVAIPTTTFWFVCMTTGSAHQLGPFWQQLCICVFLIHASRCYPNFLNVSTVNSKLAKKPFI